MTDKELPKAYEPGAHEDDIYRRWEESGKFNPDNYDLPDDADYFSIVMPPPNVTGTLHLGHASMLAYQDLMVRYNRMLGKRTLWLPGTDHASIATQAKVEKEVLAKEGKTRHDLGREKFLEKVNEFAEQSKSTIQGQVRKMGSSCDWSREHYTLDDDLTRAVQEIFVRMYNDGLIYRGDRIVNWCPRCKSTLADDEVEHEDRNTKFYTFKYSKDFPFAISTTRPETKLADTAVAVHPSDERYAEYIGKTFEIDFAGGTKLSLKVIGDHHVDKEFGTGALGVTPAHSLVDYEMAQQHDLPVIKLIDEDGKINENGGEYQGLTTEEARKKVAEWLCENDLMIEEQDVSQALSICYRCGHAIEPLPSLQWFIDVNKKVKYPDGKEESIKERSSRVVREGLIEIIPDRFNKTYFDWMDNLRDWCISRQIWFGHRMPVWYRGDEVYVGKEEPDGEGWVAESDTLDTWFSSGLWTFSTLGWPEKTKDLDQFHPTSVMETGYDILPFWVARMIIMTTYALGDIPFEKVYLHGLVRDEKGRKMSKSLGNVIDPLDMISKFGTDALRLSMIIGSAPGADSKLYEEKIEGYRNFVNKLYNIARYILTSVSEVRRVEERPEPKTLADEWILNELDKITSRVDDKIANFHFSHAGEELRDFTWNTLADWYIEIAKIEKDKDEILMYILEQILKLWHPFTPFVTEHLWEKFGTEEFLMTQSWPKLSEKISEVRFDLVQKIISSIRTMRGENKIDPVTKVAAMVITDQPDLLRDHEEIIMRLGRLSELSIEEKSGERPKQSAAGVINDKNTVYLLLEGLIDVEKEKARLEKEIEQAKKVLAGAENKLNNAQFTNNAPDDVVEQVRETAMQANDKIKKLSDQLESL